MRFLPASCLICSVAGRPVPTFLDGMAIRDGAALPIHTSCRSFCSTFGQDQRLEGGEVLALLSQRRGVSPRESQTNGAIPEPTNSCSAKRMCASQPHGVTLWLLCNSDAILAYSYLAYSYSRLGNKGRDKPAQLWNAMNQS